MRLGSYTCSQEFAVYFGTTQSSNNVFIFTTRSDSIRAQYFNMVDREREREKDESHKSHKKLVCVMKTRAKESSTTASGRVKNPLGKVNAKNLETCP